MVKAVIEQHFNASTPVGLTSAYDATRLSIGKHFRLDADGAGPHETIVIDHATFPFSVEFNTNRRVKITDDLYWIFLSEREIVVSVNTRRVVLMTFVPSTRTFTFVGSIILTFAFTFGNTRIVNFAPVLTNVTTGTVGVSGTAVTGSGTAFTTGISIGSRIGFGSTDPNAIATWYEISAIGSATGLTLTSSAGTVTAGTAYVVQDLMLVCVVSNSSDTTNISPHVAKGLRPEIFTEPATTIALAATTDKLRAVYCLKNTTNSPSGRLCVVDDIVDMNTQYVYQTNNQTNTSQVIRTNIRASLNTLVAGVQALAFPDVANARGATTDTSEPNPGGQGGALVTAGHGPSKGNKALYLLTNKGMHIADFATVNSPIDRQLDASSRFIAASMAVQAPRPGTLLFINPQVNVHSMGYAEDIDKFIVAMAQDANRVGVFVVCEFNVEGRMNGRMFCCATSQLNNDTKDTTSPAFMHGTQGNGFQGAFASIEVFDGWLLATWYPYGYTASTLTTIYPYCTDWMYVDQTGECVITPKITIGDRASKLHRVIANRTPGIGGEIHGVARDAIRLRYRTQGIDDNTGPWFSVPDDGSLSGIDGDEIQFRIEYRTLGVLQVPARVTSLALIYETELDLPTAYRWNFDDFGAAGTFAWFQHTLLGADPTSYTIDVFRSDTHKRILSQSSSSTTNGVFEHWNGSAWVAGLGTDLVGRRRRFVPNGNLPGGVPLYAKISAT